ncbi:MAG: hypothetical protein ACYST5_23070, partial [Planctomycetota bacterium]
VSARLEDIISNWYRLSRLNQIIFKGTPTIVICVKNASFAIGKPLVMVTIALKMPGQQSSSHLRVLSVRILSNGSKS